MSNLLDLMQENMSPEALMDAALNNRELLNEMLQAIDLQNRNEATRYISHQVLVLLSERHPEKLYDQWDYFTTLLRSKKSHAKYNALYIIANLVRIDTEKRFDSTFRDYFDLLDDESVVVAAHAALNAGKIARSRPDLQSRITQELTNINGPRLAPNRRELARGYAIEALSEYFEDAPDKGVILEFVTSQLQSSSPKTRKLAKQFLQRI
ncbi:MAG: hypothetical protein ACOX87_08920 [Chloroflexota bacterium]